ncbi:MAG TPA: hypothetical protein VM470_01610 [Acidimicrobiia bacterium]|nr:hypothetical protein [Acidimicrobiia bacterium]
MSSVTNTRAVPIGRARWLSPALFVVLGGSLVGLAGLAVAKILSLGFIAEAVLYVLAAAGLSAHRGLRAMLTELPRNYQVGLLALVGILTVGQFVAGGDDLYPATRWAMFNDQSAVITARSFEGLTESGERVVLKPMSLMLPLRNGRFESRLRQELARAQAGQPEQFEAIVAGLGRRYTELHPQDPLTAIEVYELRLAGESPLRVEDATHELVWTVTLEGAS